jgi:hypothetical protein
VTPSSPSPSCSNDFHLCARGQLLVEARWALAAA